MNDLGSLLWLLQWPTKLRCSGMNNGPASCFMSFWKVWKEPEEGTNEEGRPSRDSLSEPERRDGADSDCAVLKVQRKADRNSLDRIRKKNQSKTYSSGKEKERKKTYSKRDSIIELK